MTFSAELPLEELINRAFDLGYRSVRVFRGVASVTKDESTFTVDQLSETATPVQKLRDVLEQVTKTGRWSRLDRKLLLEAPKADIQQSDDLDDILG